MIETYAVVSDGVIVGVYDTADGTLGIAASMENDGIQGEIKKVPREFQGVRGQKVAEFTESWSLRPLFDRWEDGLVEINPQLKVDRDTDQIVQKGQKELIDEGFITLSPNEKWSEDLQEIILKPWADMVEEGVRSYNEWMDLVVRSNRDILLREADVVYCNPERWETYSEAERAAWGAYKQALRDFPATNPPVTEPQDIQWPVKPI